MRKISVSVRACALAGVIAAVIPAAVTAGGKKDAAKQELIVSTWGLSEDSLWSEVYEPFEKEKNVKVILDTGNAQ